MIMKKIYQMPEMMAAEMMSQNMMATSPGVKVNRTASPVDAGSVQTKGEVWDDFDE